MINIQFSSLNPPNQYIGSAPNYQICPEKSILVKKENAVIVGIIMVINTNYYQHIYAIVSNIITWHQIKK
jgi:hypothetical protein